MIMRLGSRDLTEKNPVVKTIAKQYQLVAKKKESNFKAARAIRN